MATSKFDIPAPSKGRLEPTCSTGGDSVQTGLRLDGLENQTIQNRSYLKNKILVQDQGGLTFQPAGILLYFEELKRESNTEIGPKEIIEITSIAVI